MHGAMIGQTTVGKTGIAKRIESARGAKFDCSNLELAQIRHLAARASKLFAETVAGTDLAGSRYTESDAFMDLVECHCNGCALDLAKLAGAPDFDFSHDVFGIRRHLDRTTGKLRNCFVPRCALPDPTTE